MKEVIKKLPILGHLARYVYRTLATRTMRRSFPGSEEYWKARYAAGHDSGAGSFGMLAEFKAEVLNEFVADHKLQSVIEFGCGDGNQLRLARYPAYFGFDVSETAISKCTKIFELDRTKSFSSMREYQGQKAHIALSLDVIYHLVEDEVFETYMRTLFSAAERFVVIYSSDYDDNRRHEGMHVRHRKFTRWVQRNLPEWRLAKHLPNKYPYRGDHRQGSFAEFFVYERRS